MQSSTFATLGAAIAVVGAVGATLPALFDSSDPIGYLRGASHGRKGTTTGIEAPARMPDHRWRNEQMPVLDGPGQMSVVIPESGGTPREEP